MTPEQWQQVKTLFQQVLELAPAARQHYLTEHCLDSEMRREVESLLASHQETPRSLNPDKPQEMSNSISAPDADKNDLDESRNLYTKMIGQKFNNTYRVEELLGEGSMGAVFRCTHLLLNNQVAIKVMSPQKVHSDDNLKRFWREARAGWFLSHPNIIKVLEFSQSQEGIYFMVMEYFPGETLADYIKSSAPISFTRAVEIIEPICQALDVMHQQKILHRDLKPANILIGQQDGAEAIKLSDFGIIKLLERNDQIAGDDANLTRSGDILGTVSYMAPEQIMRYKLSPATDIYSLGLIIYEMLTGELPVVAVTLEETIMLRTKGKKVLAPSTKFPTIPAEVDGILQKALSSNSADRYQDVLDLIDALKSVPIS